MADEYGKVLMLEELASCTLDSGELVRIMGRYENKTRLDAW
jgi:hypothetical protein